MAKTDIEWARCPGIIIRNDSELNPYFALTVQEQLTLIQSKPVGRQLFNNIAAEIGKKKFGYTVCIMRASSQIVMSNEPAKRWCAGNVTKGAAMNSAKDGTGTVSAIYYNPNVYITPDGKRPPYIGLAHELIHAMHNLKGTSKTTTHDDEYMVVGFGSNSDLPVTENAIRAEHNVEARASYAGV